MKKTDMKKKSNIAEKDEESEHFDFLYAGLLISIFLFLLFFLGVFGKLSVYVYKTTGSILYATMTFILGIILDLAFSGIFLIDCDCKIVDYLMYLLIVFLITEMILALISLV